MLHEARFVGTSVNINRGWASRAKQPSFVFHPKYWLRYSDTHTQSEKCVGPTPYVYYPLFVPVLLCLIYPSVSNLLFARHFSPPRCLSNCLPSHQPPCCSMKHKQSPQNSTQGFVVPFHCLLFLFFVHKHVVSAVFPVFLYFILEEYLINLGSELLGKYLNYSSSRTCSFKSCTNYEPTLIWSINNIDWSLHWEMLVGNAGR